MKKIIIWMVLMLLLVLVPTQGAVGDEINENVFAQMSRSELQSNLNPSFSGKSIYPNYLEIDIKVNGIEKVDGKYYIQKQYLYSYLSLKDINDCFDLYTTNQCYNFLVNNNQIINFEGRMIEPVIYQYLINKEKYLDILQEMQQEILNRNEDNSDLFDWWGLFD